MPEINLRVKIIGGKKTKLAVYAASMAVNEKKITFPSGLTVSDAEIETVIVTAIKNFIEI